MEERSGSCLISLRADIKSCGMSVGFRGLYTGKSKSTV